MAIAKDNTNNTYYFYGAYTDPITRRRKQYKRRGFKSASQAKKAEDKFIYNINNKPKTDLKFSDVVVLYLTNRESRIKEGSLYDITKRIDKHILPYFANFKMTEISYEHIEAWQQDLLNERVAKRNTPYKNATLINIQSQLSVIFNFAITLGIIKVNPVSGLGLVKRKDEEIKEIRYWTREQYQQYRTVIDDDEFLMIFDTLYFTGLRIGELQALRWKDLRLDSGQLYIHANYNSKLRKIVETTKNESNRYVPLSSKLLERFKERYSIFSEYADFDENKLIFGYYKPIAHKTIENRKNSYFQKYNEFAKAKNLELLPYITIHEFRHSHASLLINAGIDRILVANRLGHTVQMVEHIYGHLYKSTLQKVVNELDKVEF